MRTCWPCCETKRGLVLPAFNWRVRCCRSIEHSHLEHSHQHPVHSCTHRIYKSSWCVLPATLGLLSNRTGSRGAHLVLLLSVCLQSPGLLPGLRVDRAGGVDGHDLHAHLRQHAQDSADAAQPGLWDGADPRPAQPAEAPRGPQYVQGGQSCVAHLAVHATYAPDVHSTCRGGHDAVILVIRCIVCQAEAHVPPRTSICVRLHLLQSELRAISYSGRQNAGQRRPASVRSWRQRTSRAEGLISRRWTLSSTTTCPQTRRTTCTASVARRAPDARGDRSRSSLSALRTSLTIHDAGETALEPPLDKFDTAVHQCHASLMWGMSLGLAGD